MQSPRPRLNIHKIKGVLGYQTGTPLKMLVDMLYDSLPDEEKIPRAMMLLELDNFVNADPLVYPLNVLDIDGVDIGNAGTGQEYMSIWNANAYNRTKGVIISANGLFFEFAPVNLNTSIILYASNI